MYLGYMYIDLVLLPFTYKFALKYYPKIAYATFKSMFFKIFQKSFFVMFFKKSWRRKISFFVRWCKIKTKKFNKKMIFKFKKSPLHLKIIYFSIPIGIMTFITIFFSFLWFFIIPIFGIPNALKLWVKKYIIMLSGKLGLTHMLFWIYGVIPDFFKKKPELMYSSLKVKLFRILVKFRYKFYKNKKILILTKKFNKKALDKRNKL